MIQRKRKLKQFKNWNKAEKMANIETGINRQRLMGEQKLLLGQGLISDCAQKISNYLKLDRQQDSLLLAYNGNDPVILELQIRKSAQYLQTLRKNSYKIQQLIMDNERIKRQVELQRKTIEMHLKKQIQLKYTISNLQEQLQLANQKIILLQEVNIKQSIQYQQNSSTGISPKQIYKLQQKLHNCIQQNAILRQQNQTFRQLQFTKEQNYLQIQKQFKLNLNTLSQQVQSLNSDLHYQTQKNILLDKIQGQNIILKSQNKRLQSIMDAKLFKYESKIISLLQQLNHLKQDKQIFKEKYEELTDIINMVDQMRLQFKTKKKILQYNQQSLDLLQPIQLTSNSPLLSQTKPINLRKSSEKSSKKQNNS